MTGVPSVLFVCVRNGGERMRLVRDDIAARVQHLAEALAPGAPEQ